GGGAACGGQERAGCVPGWRRGRSKPDRTSRRTRAERRRRKRGALGGWGYCGVWGKKGGGGPGVARACDTSFRAAVARDDAGFASNPRGG
ncbi:hypothetical protein T484DRAFT_1884973, partial [Baffinella frigidus]